MPSIIINVNPCRICNRGTSNAERVCVSCLDMFDNGFWPKSTSPVVREYYDFIEGHWRSYIEPNIPYEVDWEYNPEYASFCKDYLLKEC